jgi:hypothetical protein
MISSAGEGSGTWRRVASSSAVEPRRDAQLSQVPRVVQQRKHSASGRRNCQQGRVQIAQEQQPLTERVRAKEPEWMAHAGEPAGRRQSTEVGGVFPAEGVASVAVAAVAVAGPAVAVVAVAEGGGPTSG